MQEYLTRTRLGAAIDKLGSTLLILFAGMGTFFLLWGIRPVSVLAGTALGIMLLVLRESTRKQRLRRREDALRRRIGGEIKLEQWLLTPPRRAHFEAALLLSQAYNLSPKTANEDGALCINPDTGEKMLIFCGQVHRKEEFSVRDVAALQRICLKEKIPRGVVCGIGRISPEARQQALLSPVLRIIHYDKMIALAGAAWPATDDQLIALGRRKHQGQMEKMLLGTILSPSRDRNYLTYGLLLCVLYLIFGMRACLIPGIVCLILMALCRIAGRKPAQIDAL
ncbi:MAG: hypothetical protein IKW00_03555 [Clostridia bacterium]|nr:hypothetical protein [Clostridia bacterium]